MKNTLQIFLVLLLTCFLSYLPWMPWWLLLPVGMLAGVFIQDSVGKSFAAGFAAGFIGWLVLALWQHIPNDGILTNRVGLLFQGLSAWQMIAFTALIGALLGGLGASTGAALRLWLKPPRKKRRRY